MTAELHTLVGAYALDALTGAEEADFERHLDSCATCAAELVEFRETTARLADAFSAEPPAELRGQVLLAARRTVQARPVLRAADAPAPPSHRGRAWTARRAGVTGLLVAAALVAVAAVGGLWLNERSDNDDLLRDQERIEAIMTAADREVSPPRDEAPLQVFSSASLGEAVIMVELPDINEDYSYELWALDAEGAAESLGTLPEADESGTKLVDALDDAAAVAVTREPAGGSPTGQPTSDPVQVVDLT